MKLLGQDEFADVVALLDRITLDALLLVSRKSCDVIQALLLRIARRSMGFVLTSVAVHRGKVPRFLDRFRKTPRPWPHEIYAQTGFEHQDDLEKHFGNDASHERGRLWRSECVLPSPEDCYRYLSYGLPVSRIETLHLNFRPTSSAIAEAFQSPDVRHGCIDYLVFGCDANDYFRLEPNVFENLPLLSGSIHYLELRGSVSPQQQSDRFVRNCMRRCVRILKAARKDWGREKIPRGVCDVREDTILEFCFRSDLQEHCEECHWTWRGRGPEVQLWLNFVSLSDDFLHRFVQASENCASDHKVWLFLCGDNFNRLHLSADAYSYVSSHRKRFTYRGKMGVDVVLDLELRILVAIRRSLEETPPTDVYVEADVNFIHYMSLSDGLVNCSPPPPRTLRERIRTNTVGRFRRFMYEWF